jgi:outer membrane lipoprotein-sorting protein
MTLHPLSLLAVLLAVPSIGVADDNTIDPKAKQTLEAMVRAYRNVHTLRQETVYDAGDSTTPGVARAMLVLQRPNKLLVEISHRGAPQDQPVVSRYQCDGKFVYSYQSIQGWYTKEKAPKDMQGFKTLAISVEMAAIAGLNPVEALLKPATSVQMAETTEVDGIETDVVVILMHTADRRAETKLYIGRKDHFLRRFSFYSEVTKKPEPEKPAKEYDPNNPNDRPVPPPPPVRFSYDNHLIVDKPIAKDTFAWVPPASAFEYRTTPGYVPANGTKVEAGGLIPGTSTVAPQGMKIISLQELTKKAKKPNKK